MNINKKALYFSCSIMILGQILFTLIVTEQIPFSPYGQQAEWVGATFLRGWFLLALFILGGTILFYAFKIVRTFRVLIAAVLQLIFAACILGMRYMQNSNSRYYLFCSILGQCILFSYIFIKVAIGINQAEH